MRKWHAAVQAGSSKLSRGTPGGARVQLRLTLCVEAERTSPEQREAGAECAVRWPASMCSCTHLAGCNWTWTWTACATRWRAFSGGCRNFRRTPAEKKLAICPAVQCRYVLMHAFGGLYLDLDVECLRNAEEGLAGFDVVLQRERGPDTVGTGVLASVPGRSLVRTYGFIQISIKSTVKPFTR